jgi:hypothetical protein
MALPARPAFTAERRGGHTFGRLTSTPKVHVVERSIHKMSHFTVRCWKFRLVPQFDADVLRAVPCEREELGTQRETFRGSEAFRRSITAFREEAWLGAGCD